MTGDRTTAILAGWALVVERRQLASRTAVVRGLAPGHVEGAVRRVLDSFVAYVIDAVLLNVIAIPLNLLLFGNSGAVCVTSNYVVMSANHAIHGVSFSCSPTGWGFLIYFLLGLIYFTFMWSTGATLGQRVLKVHVADARTGSRLSLTKCLIRYVGFCLSAIPLAVGLIWAGIDMRKQGWHDKIADSVVVRNSAG